MPDEVQIGELSERGIALLIKELEDLPAKSERKVKKALEKAAKVFLKHIKEEAPQRARLSNEKRNRRSKAKGPIRNAFKITDIKVEGNSLSVTIEEDDTTKTPGWDGPNYGLILTQGAQPHPIVPRPDNPKGLLYFSFLANFQPLPRNRQGQVIPGVPKGGPRAVAIVVSGGIGKFKGYDVGRKAPKGASTGGNRISRRSRPETIIVSKGVVHPGVKPNDFIARAEEKALPEIEHIMESLLDEIVRQ